jgi:hypothetical protein
MEVAERRFTVIPKEIEPGEPVSPERTLIYTTAFGKEYYFLLAEELCRSLAKVGYRGEVLVLTDRPYRFTGAEAVVMTHSPVLYKAGLHRYVDVTRYDRILCCDGDVVFLRDPAPVLACGWQGMAVSYELDHPLAKASHNLRYFSREEKARISRETHPLLNVGLTVFHPARIADYCGRWEESWIERVPDRFQIWEQAVMQRLVTLHDLECGLVPRRYFSFPLLRWDPRPLGEETVAVHPCGLAWTEQNKARVLRIMRALNESETHDERSNVYSIVRRREWQALPDADGRS